MSGAGLQKASATVKFSLSGGTTDQLTAAVSSTRYWSLGGYVPTASSEAVVPAWEAPFACTLKALRVRLAAVVPTSDTVTVTVRKNAVDTILLVAIAAAAQAGSDLADTVTLAAGDRITISCAIAGSGAAGSVSGECSIEVDPT